MVYRYIDYLCLFEYNLYKYAVSMKIIISAKLIKIKIKN